MHFVKPLFASYSVFKVFLTLQALKTDYNYATMKTVIIIDCSELAVMLCKNSFYPTSPCVFLRPVFILTLEVVITDSILEFI